MTVYKVKQGDTLSSISKRYGVSVSELQKANSKLIKDINKISVGWVLSIPSKASEKHYEEIGRAVETALNDIKKLKSVQRLQSLLGE